MKRFVDCHAHLSDSQFHQDIDEVIERAKISGVKAVIVVSEYNQQHTAIIELADRFRNFCFPAFGVHPVQHSEDGSEKSVSAEDLDGFVLDVEKFQERLICIGEIGLDFTPRWCSTETDKETQKAVLLAQVDVAKQYGLPINVHSRSAGRPTIALLKETGAERVLLHAFDGKPSVAMTGVQCGFYVSIPPSIVRSEQKEKLVKSLPLDKILLESDSPSLGPDRTIRNEPCNVVVACEYIAKLKNVDADTVAQITTENALKLFPKLSQHLLQPESAAT